ncbi:MAG: hypothetical protein ABSF13_05200 [Smithella sp.]
MKTITDNHYKHDDKKDLNPEELVKAKTACEFVINLTKAISRSGYYDSNHPISGEVKRGLYDSFKNALGSCSEIMLTCHDSGEVTDIHISGILDEPVNIRRLTKAEASDLFVPKLKDYFERKSLNSFVIKNNITPQHFESFIDVMGEPIADSADSSKLGEYLTKALVDLDITEVSTVFKTDIVLLRGKLPWRVSIILRRLAKDMKVIPMFRSASVDKIKEIKSQIIEDIIRPLNNPDLLRDLIVNGDVIVSHLAQSLETNELEQMFINSLPAYTVVPVSQAVFDVYKESKDELRPDQDDSVVQQRCKYLETVLNMAVKRIDAEQLPDAADLFKLLYEHEIIPFDMLPEEIQFNIKTKELAGYIISEIDIYIDKALNASSIEDMEAIVITFHRVISALIRLREWPVINKIVQAVCSFSSRKDVSLNTSELLLNLPDSIFEGSDEIFAEEYIHAEKDVRDQMNEILEKMTSMCIKVFKAVFDKCRDPNVLKNAIDLVSKKGELARQWSIKILDDRNQSLPLLNIALLVIINVGHDNDIGVIKKYTKHPNPNIRTRALDATVKLNKKDAEVLIIEALNDEDEKVRDRAATLIERESSLSEESVNSLYLFIKTKLLQKKDITIHEAKRLAGLLRAIGKLTDCVHKEPLEDQILGIVSDLLKGRTGLLKFIKADINEEQLEIIDACVSTLGKIGGSKSKTFLNTISRGNTTLSKVAHEAIEELDKNLI